MGSLTTLDNLNIDACLVYVEAYKSLGNNFYSVIYADFMSNRDFETFSTELNLQFDREKSMLEIRNYRSFQRLRPASYYRLNIEALRTNSDFSPKKDEESALIAYIIDMHNNELEDGRILTRRTYKEPTRNNSVYNYSRNPSYLQGYQVDTLRVNDTGQGNWNELLGEADVKIVYDIGTNIQAKQSEMMKLWNSREKEYASTRPSLFVSHWDMDHFNILKVLSEKDIANHFSEVFCVCKTPSLTSQRVYKKLCSALPYNVFTFHNANKGGRLTLTTMQKQNGNVDIYVGEHSRSTNLAGIQLFIKGKEREALLTGDCNYNQVNTILQNSYNTCFPLVFVVPHHGAEVTRNHIGKIQLNMPHRMLSSVAVISVDENNSYGHPRMGTINYLKRYFDKTKRTDRPHANIIEDL